MSRLLTTVKSASGDDEAVGALFQQIVEAALSLGASDLFLTSEERYVGVLVRRLGSIHPLRTLEITEGRRCMNYIKALAGLDLAERRRPVDGRWIYTRANGDKIDLRINTIPTLHGEDFTLRMLSRDTAVGRLNELGLTHGQWSDLRAMLGVAGGLILVTGPSGAGKTTTLYACLRELNDGKRKINTIEDPIEFAIPGLRQSQVNPTIGLDFPELLRSILRQSPDVVLVGEIRDTVTAQTAIRAANSGHLVLATLHAPVAAAAVQSMRALEVNPHFLAASLLGIVAQRLVRTLNPETRVPHDVSEAPMTFDDVRQWLQPGEGSVIYSAPFGKADDSEGYAGRTGVFEVLTMNRRLRQAVIRDATARELHDLAIADGMLEFRLAGLLKVAQGVTSMEELLRVIPAEHLGLEA